MWTDLTAGTLIMALAAFAAAAPAKALDLQGHRGARGLWPENTLTGFARALSIGVTTLELDLAMTKDGVLVVSHDSVLNPDHTRGPDGQFLAAPGPAILTLTLSELARYDVGRLKPGTAYARRHPGQQAVDGARIPTLQEVFDLVERLGAAHVRFNIETKLTPHGTETPDPEKFAAAVAATVRAAGLADRVTVQSFDWRTLVILGRIAPELARSCLTVEAPGDDTIQRGRPGPSPWAAGFDIDAVGGSVPKLVAAVGATVWSPNFHNVTAALIDEAHAAGLAVVPWTVNDEADMARLIEIGVDGLISDYPDRLRKVMADKGLPLPPRVKVE